MGQTGSSTADFLATNQAPEAELRLFAKWNYTNADYPMRLCVHQLVEEQAEATPQATAVVCGSQSLTYAELNHRANQLARYLQGRGVSSETLVGLRVERCAEMVIALLAILKAGGTYVPLDPTYPRERIKDVLEDARVPLLITQQNLLSSIPKVAAENVCLDTVWAETQEFDTANLTNLSAPEKLMYVIYTSGSTGKPKGVQIEHRSVVNLLTSMRGSPGLEAQDVLVAVTTLSFDIAGLEIYLPLVVGARLVVADRETTHDGRKLLALLENSSATVMQATPATWRLLIDAGWKGNKTLKVLCGGEAFPAELARELVRRGASVWNLYGPTETTIWSSLYRVTGGEKGVIPIGRPIANTELHILNQQLQPVPIGAEGELYIGGDGLARGYFERPHLTTEKFVAHPTRTGARLYRTGDLARYQEGGVVEFLGRIDHQVKIRGFRVELGEIETLLEQHSQVRQAVVVARGNSVGDKSLVAYLVADPALPPARSELRAHLQQHLPDYMIPSAFVQLPVLPLTPNGKVDRKALPVPAREDFEVNHDYVAARDPLERKLVAICEGVLGISRLGVTTSLFELGMHSLQVAQVFMKISREFGRDLPLAVLFEAPTIEQLAAFVRPHAVNSFTTLVAVQPRGSKLPLFCVHGGAGTTLYLHKLASYLGPDQPIYGLESEGLDGKRIHRRRVEQMAAHYLSQIRKVQKNGPYLLGGYCFGGIVAFEMARQLTEQGEQVALVAMLNAPLRFNRRSADPPLREAGLHSAARRSGGLRRLRAAMRWRLTYLREWAQVRGEKVLYRLLPGLRIAIPQSLRTLYVLRMTEQAEKDYTPELYPGRLTLFRGRGVYDHDPELGWTGLASGGLETCDIGDDLQEGRREMINEPVVGKLAQQLKICIDRISSGWALEKASTDRERRAAAQVIAGDWTSGEAWAGTGST